MFCCSDILVNDLLEECTHSVTKGFDGCIYVQQKDLK